MSRPSLTCRCLTVVVLACVVLVFISHAVTAATPTADILLAQSSATMTQARDTPWSLAKTGTVDTVAEG